MISHPSTSGRQRTVEFRALPSRTGQVRRIVSAQLRYWKLDALVDPAAVGVARLLSTVHRHVGPERRCTVEIVLRLDRLTISVRDHDPYPAPLRPPGAPVTGGPAAARSDGTGKALRFTLPVPAPAVPGDASEWTPGRGPRQEPLPPPEPLPAPEPLPGPDPLPRAHASARTPAASPAPHT